MPKEKIVTKDYSGDDRRTCEGCSEERTALQRLIGASKVRGGILTIVLLFVLGGGLYGVFVNKATADIVQGITVRVALTEAAIEELKKLAEEAKKYREHHDDKHDSDKKEIIQAIRER